LHWIKEFAGAKSQSKPREAAVGGMGKRQLAREVPRNREQENTGKLVLGCRSSSPIGGHVHGNPVPR
jgi:hypothetical protein